MDDMPSDRWGDGRSYDEYMGRWSRRVAADFLAWLAVPAERSWVDVGCGTGSLAGCIVAQCAPAAVTGVDRSEGFVAVARREFAGSGVCFEVGDAVELPLQTASMDAAVSGLVLNFLTDPQAVVGEMARVTKPGGKVGVYVWDYAGDMEVLRRFWDAAVEVNPQDAALDEGMRFPICRPEALRDLFEGADLHEVSVRAIDVQAVFRDFDDYWTPFLGGIGPAPTYLASLDDQSREQIRCILRGRLVANGDRAVSLAARAWAVQGIV